MRQSACLVFNPVMVNNYAAFFNYTLMGRASDYDGPDLKLFIKLVGAGASCLLLGPPGFNWCFFGFSVNFSVLRGSLLIHHDGYPD